MDVINMLFSVLVIKQIWDTTEYLSHLILHEESVVFLLQSKLLQKVQIGKDQEKAQSAKDSHSKNPRWEKTKLTIRYLYHENIS